MIRQIQKDGYRIAVDTQTGKWIGLYDRADADCNWLFEESDTGFCTPFVHGTQFSQDELVCPLEMTEDGLRGHTESGATRIEIKALDDRICGKFETPTDNGPRIGLHMNLNFLDLPSQCSWERQCMPKIIYVDEDYGYGYFVFATADRRYMILTVSGPFAAWRIRYSYEGHRMIGFQLLTQADDVRTDGRRELPVVGGLDFEIRFADDLSACLPKAAEALELPIVVPKISGGPVGADVPVEVLGTCREITITDPDGGTAPLEGNRIRLLKPGVYQVTAVSENGRPHVTRLLCHEGWERQLDRVNEFYCSHMQHACGAFFQGAASDTYAVDMDAIGGVRMGDPFSHYSCRCGEFGGFSGWAMIKNLLLFGEKKELTESVERYIYNWLLNRGHEDKPYFGTLNKKPASFLGRDYGAYHMFEEYNYMQHEIFLLEELADFYHLTGDESVREDAMHVVEHIVREHLSGDGSLICQNFPDEPGVDYSTVHIPVQAFLRWAEILKEEAPEKAVYLRGIAEKIADHVCRRGLDFPTEGEPCTEDGSMGCSAATLIYAYEHVAAKPEYLRVAKEILNAHHVLEMDGTDCRMKNSTIRFWETQYETRQWGASINAGHAWTIWTSEAKAALAMLEHDVQLLQEAYEGFLTNISKVSPCGGMYCCYTPDMIPGTPHAYWLDHMQDQTVGHNDLRPTTTHLGMKNPSGYFAASGNYYLIKASEIWDHISGVELTESVAINGVLEGSVFRSEAPNFDRLLIGGAVTEPVTVLCRAGAEVELLTDGQQLCLTGAEILEQSAGRYVVLVQGDRFTICSD